VRVCVWTVGDGGSFVKQWGYQCIWICMSWHECFMISWTISLCNDNSCYNRALTFASLQTRKGGTFCYAEYAPLTHWNEWHSVAKGKNNFLQLAVV